MPSTISIVTPSFNQLDWLALAIASVSDQEGVYVEHIVQDGGTPGIEAFLVQNSNPSPNERHRVKLFVEKDAGMYDALNRGLTKATGDICGHLNCDEQYLPGTLAAAGEYFADHPDTDVLFGDMILVDPTGRPISYRRTVLPTLRHIQFAHLNTPTCATFFRRRIFEQGLRFDPTWKSIGDGVWVQSMLKAGVRMATMPRAFAVFTQTGKNLGAAPITGTEASAHRGAAQFSSMQRFATKLWQRVRKAFAGAYRPRNVKIDIFTPDSPARRRSMSAVVGFGWKTN